MKYGGMCVLKWSAATLGIAGALLFLPLKASAGANDAAPTVVAQGPAQSIQALSAMESVPQAIPTANSTDRETPGLRARKETTKVGSP